MWVLKDSVSDRWYINTLWCKPQLSRQNTCWSLRCSWRIACRCCSMYILILDLTPVPKWIGQRQLQDEREKFKIWDSVRLLLEVLLYLKTKLGKILLVYFSVIAMRFAIWCNGYCVFFWGVVFHIMWLYLYIEIYCLNFNIGRVKYRNLDVSRLILQFLPKTLKL